MKSDTPRTDALIKELAVDKLATFEDVLIKTKKHVEFTRALEREINRLKETISKNTQNDTSN